MNFPKTGPEWVFAASYENFHKRVLDVSQQHPVLVDFWAEWCSPCLVIAPVLERIISEYAGTVLLAKIEVDVGENMKLAGHYRVRGFPTVMMFRKGEERGRFSGAHPAPFVREFVETHRQ